MASRFLSSCALSWLVLSLAACDTPPVTPDTGAILADVPVLPDTPPPPFTCEGDNTVIDGVLGETATVMFDTTMTDERPRDLGVRCGNPSGEGVRWARQEVVEYHVPGTGPVGIEFSAINAVTAMDFNTVIQVRTDCDVVPDQAFPPTCIDDATSTEARSRGAYQAMGGDTIYFIVTGYSDPPPIQMQVDEGPIQVTFTPRVNTPPTIITASAVVNGTAMLLRAEATDAEGPIFGYALQLFTAAGQIDLEGDGDADDQDIIPFGWETVTGSNPYVGSSVVTPDGDGYRLAEYCAAVGCTEAGIAVFDQQFAASAFVRVPITPPMLSGDGEPCDGVGLVCTSGLNCVGGACEISARVATACSMATAIAIEEPVDDTPTTATVSGFLNRGAGAFYSPCSEGTNVEANSIGREAIYRIDIDVAGNYRLDLTTALPGTGTRNTILYVRGDCWDSRPDSSLGCNDDATGGLASELSLEVGEGTYYVFVEFFDGVMTTSAAYELQATLTRLP
jgi:hypothetical protein